jgi:hypothetical protein
VVCALGWKLLADILKPADVTPDPIHAKLIAVGRAFSPLTLPMTIDAGVISVAITVGANHAHSFKHAVIQLLAAVIGAAIVAFSILLTYSYAQRVSRRIGHTGMMVPPYHVVPSRDVAKHTSQSHSEWLRTPGRGGRQYVDNPVYNFSDPDDKYLEKWDLLGL